MALTKIKPRDIQQDGASTNDVLTWDGSVWAPAAPTGGGDILDGGNTTGATLVIGTNDAQSLELETNGSSFLYANSAGDVGIGTTPSTGTTFTVLKTDTSTSGTPITATIKQLQNPASNSSASARALNMGVTYNAPGINFTGAPQAGWFENRLQNVGDISNIYGITTSGILMGGDAATVGTIANATGIQTSGTSSFSNSIAGTVTLARGLLVNNSLKASLTITNQVGINISALSSGTNNTALLMGTNTVPSGNFGIYSTITDPSYFAGTIGIGTASPDASAILDIVTTTKGLGLPSMTTTQRNAISAPRDGLVVYDSTLDLLYLRANGAWVSLDSGTPDGNGIYTGSGTIPASTQAALTASDWIQFTYDAGGPILWLDDSTGVSMFSPAGSSLTLTDTGLDVALGASSEINLTINGTNDPSIYMNDLATVIGTATYKMTVSPDNQNIIFEIPTASLELYNSGINAISSYVSLGNGATASELRFLEPSGGGSSYTGFKAPALAANLMYTLPTTATDGYFLKYNSSGNQLEWAAGLNGIYGGSGTIPASTSATVTSTSTFDIKYAGGNLALSIDDTDTGTTIWSKDNASFVYVSNNSTLLESNVVASLAVTSGNALTISTTEAQFAGPVAIAPIGGATSIDANAILQLDGVTGGLLLNRLTTTERNSLSTVPDGLLLYNTTTDTLTLRANGAWVELGTSGGDGDGIYDGSGTIAASTVATLTASSSFKINYSTAQIGFQIDDVDNSITLYSDSGNSFVYVNDTSVNIDSIGDAHLIAAPSSDHSFSGTTVTLTANENQAFGDVIYIASDGDAALADADAIATAKVVGMCTETVTTGNPARYLLMGIARDDTWTWTVGGHIYLSTTGTTGNTLTQTAPSGTDDCVVVVGVATHADRMLFNPSYSISEHV